MTRKFIARIINERTVDTRNYQYRFTPGRYYRFMIVRIDRQYLGKANYLNRNNWEIVKTFDSMYSIIEEYGDFIK